MSNFYLKRIFYMCWILILPGCVGTQVYHANLPADLPKYICPESTPAFCDELANHFLAINHRGVIEKIDFDGCAHPYEVQPMDILKNIKSFIEKSKSEDAPKKLLIFIHGGLTDPESTVTDWTGSLTRFAQDYVDMTCKLEKKEYCRSEIYPLYIIWPSGFFDTYGDSIWNYYQGEWGDNDNSYNLIPKISSPLRFIHDLANIVVDAPESYFHQIKLWWDAEYVGKTILSKNLGKYAGNFCKGYSGFHCDNNPRFGEDTWAFWEKQTVDNSFRVLFPLKFATTPLADPIGRRAWDSMISRAHFGMWKPSNNKLGFLPAKDGCKDEKDRINCRQKGDINLFFDELQKRISEDSDYSVLKDLPITLIGHSMGAILASSVIHEHPDLNYEDIVFMAAAAPVSQYKIQVEPILKQKLAAGKPTKFYNLTLHPFAEATETFMTDPVPAGSLLEWIDYNFTNPSDMEDRTLGKWVNLVSNMDYFDQSLFDKNVFFKRFDLTCHSPVKHGQFASQLSDLDKEKCDRYPYWVENYWKEWSE